MKIAILTSPNQWFVKYAKELNNKIMKSSLFYDHKDLNSLNDILFILAYHRIIDEEYLNLNKHNIVIHESDLPEGKGWAPLFWQILEGKMKLYFLCLKLLVGLMMVIYI